MNVQFLTVECMYNIETITILLFYLLLLYLKLSFIVRYYLITIPTYTILLYYINSLLHILL